MADVLIRLNELTTKSFWKIANLKSASYFRSVLLNAQLSINSQGLPVVEWGGGGVSRDVTK